MLKAKIDINKIKLEIPNPLWDSELAILATDLEKLRIRTLSGTTPVHIFFEIKNIFQILESLGSARIEGNNTTISELVEKIIEETDHDQDEQLREIFNIDRAIKFINEYIKEDVEINKMFINEIHKIVVSNLKREGSKNIGNYRKENVSIAKSYIVVPDFLQIENYMEQLFDFINENNNNHNHLFRIAIAHHYFTFIHPFDNGNGRVVRLLTFAMLVKYGFNVKHGSILNPTAIFCNDRNEYYRMLNLADNGNIEEWCIYVLKGLKEEIVKIDKISDVGYVRKMFTDVLVHALNQKYLDEDMFNILSIIVKSNNMSISAGDISSIKKFDTNLKRSRIIRKMKGLKFIKSLNSNTSRIYTISFEDNILFRSLVHILRDEGFIPSSLDKNN